MKKQQQKNPYSCIPTLVQSICKKQNNNNKKKTEDHWSCIAHLSAEDMLKSVIIEEKK